VNIANAAKMHKAVEKAEKETDSNSCLDKLATNTEEEKDSKYVSYSKYNVLTSKHDDDTIKLLCKYSNYWGVFNNPTKTAIIYTILVTGISYVNFISKIISRQRGQVYGLFDSLETAGIIQRCDDLDKIKSFNNFIGERLSYAGGHRGIGQFHVDNIHFYELCPEAKKVYEPLKAEIAKRLSPSLVRVIDDYKKAWMKTHDQVQASIKETRKVDKVSEARMMSIKVKRDIVQETINNNLSFADFVKLINKHKKDQGEAMKAELDGLLKSITTWNKHNDWEKFEKVWSKYGR
jgi:hypothetical protein